MAEFRENFITDPEAVQALVKLVNTKFTLSLSPYDTLEQAFTAALRSMGVTVGDAETLDTLVYKLIDNLELPVT